MRRSSTWAAGRSANFNDAEQNKIGADNIGFAPFPDVEGGAGSIDQVPANIGIPIMLSKKGYDDDTAAWLKCIVENYGDTVTQRLGRRLGLRDRQAPR